MWISLDNSNSLRFKKAFLVEITKAIYCPGQQLFAFLVESAFSPGKGSQKQKSRIPKQNVRILIFGFFDDAGRGQKGDLFFLVVAETPSIKAH